MSSFLNKYFNFIPIANQIFTGGLLNYSVRGSHFRSRHQFSTPPHTIYVFHQYIFTNVYSLGKVGLQRDVVSLKSNEYPSLSIVSPLN